VQDPKNDNGLIVRLLFHSEIKLMG